MDMVERYINAVISHLPKEMQDHSREEIRSKIEKMLPENPNENDIRTVLEYLGNPIIFADEFRGVKRYLIGPDLYYPYLSSLKTVAIIISLLSCAVAIIDGFLHAPIESSLITLVAELFAKILSAVFQGVTIAFFWVTVIFVVIERNGKASAKTSPFFKKKWTVDHLTELAPQKSKISRADPVFNSLFTILFTAVICFKPEIISLYINKDHYTISTPVFILDRLHAYIPLFILLAVLAIGVNIYKFIVGKWSIPLAVANSVQNVAASIVILVMAMDDSLFNHTFFSHFAQAANIPLSQVTAGWTWGIRMFAAFFIIGSLISSLQGFAKSRKIF